MENALYIAGAIALLALAALFLYLISFIKGTRGVLDGATKTMADLSGEIREIRQGLMGTLQNVQGITGELQGTVERVNRQLDHVDVIVGNVGRVTTEATEVIQDATDVIHEGKEIVMSLLHLEQRIQASVQEPIVEITTIFSAIGKGIRAFRKKIAGNPSANGTAPGMSASLGSAAPNAESDWELLAGQGGARDRVLTDIDDAVPAGGEGY